MTNQHTDHQDTTSGPTVGAGAYPLPNALPSPRITREEAVRLYLASAEGTVELAREPTRTGERFGRCELQGLLDQIYGYDSEGKPVELVTIPEV